MTKRKTEPQGAASGPATSRDVAGSLDPAPWADLFDADEMRRACDAVRDCVDAFVRGESSGVFVPIRPLLMRWLEAFIARETAKDPESTEARAAHHLYNEATAFERACGRGGFLPAERAFSAGDGIYWHDRLQAAWFGLIEAAARQREWQRTQNKQNQKPYRGRMSEITPKALVARMAAAGVSRLEKDFVLTYAEELLLSWGLREGQDDFAGGIEAVRRTLQTRLKAARLNDLIAAPSSASVRSQGKLRK